MENLLLIGSVALLHLLAAMSPGPDFIMAVKNSLSYSRKIGIYTAVGFGLGISVHIFYCLAGLAMIISKSIITFNIIKYLGALYLIYIGLKSFFGQSAKTMITEEKKLEDITPFSAIKIGFLTNVLNPKATLFFLGLFTLVISPRTPAWVLCLTSVIMIIDTVLWFSAVAIFFTQEKVRLIFNRFQNIFNKTFGGLLILLGLKVAISEK